MFVTGTDTGVGKTRIACALLHAFTGRGMRAVGMKPVAAGAMPGARSREMYHRGEVDERFKSHAWKACLGS